MKKYILLFALIICSPMAFAEGLKIAVVDAQAVIRGANFTKDAISKLKEKNQEFQSKMASLQKELFADKKALDAKRGIISDEKFEEEASKLRKKARSYQSDAQSMQEEIQREEFKLRRSIELESSKVIDELARERNIDAVISRQFSFYVKPELDMTNDVLDLVNQRMKK